MKKLFLVLCALLTVVACEQKTKEKTVYVGTKDEKTEPEQAKGESRSLKKIRAEKLVAAAEQLFSQVGFMYCDEILDKALAADPTNRKARFYKAFLAPAMKLRGINSRLKTLDKTGVVLKNYQYLEQIGGGVREFFNQAGAPFNSEADAQKVINEFYLEQQKLRDFINENKSWVARITVPFAEDSPEVPQWMYGSGSPGSGSLMLRNCVVTKISKDTYRLSACPYINMLSLRTNRGDWEAILQSWNSGRMFATFALSYDPTGIAALLAENPKNDKERVEQINKHQNLGKLLSPNLLTKGIEYATDVHVGAKWLNDNQSHVCGKADLKEHVFRDGICTSKDMELGPHAYAKPTEIVTNLGQSISGEGGVMRFTKPHTAGLTGQVLNTVNFHPLALFKNPVANLKSLLPNKFDPKCNSATEFADNKFGGVFKDGDAHLFALTKFDCTDYSTVFPDPSTPPPGDGTNR